MKIFRTERVKKCGNSKSHHAFRPDELSVNQLNLSDDLKDNLPLELDSIPIAFDRRAFRHCCRFLSGYRRG